MEAVYLDNSATTRCCKEAAGLVAKLLLEDYGNPSSLHRKGMEAENYVKEARAKIARTLKCREKEIYFTSGGTESNNLAIFGAAEANRRKGKHIITTPIEHASVANAMLHLKELGYELTYLPVDERGVISLEALRASVREDTVLVSIMQVNNEIGTVMPVEQAGRIIKELNPGALFHVDAVQSYGKMRIFPAKAGIDLLSVSGHKIHGPKGSGFLYVKEKTKLCPLVYGGGQQGGLRSGTENVPAIAGLGAAAELAYASLDARAEHMYALREHFVKEAGAIDGVRINGMAGLSGKTHAGDGMAGREGAPHIVSVSVDGVRAEVLLHALEERGIYVSAGSACSSNKPAVSATLRAVGLPEALLDSTVRISFSADTTMEETDCALAAMRELIPALRKFKRY